MKFRLRKPLAILSCAAAGLITLSACNFGSTLLGKPQKVVPASHGELIADEFVAFTQKEETFAAKLAACTYENYDGGENFTVSPISVYTALSLAAECAAGDTRDEILSALSVTHTELKKNISTLYRSLANDVRDGLTILDMTNSIWVDESTQVNKSCIDALSNDYYCYSYSANFKKDNAAANGAVRRFVKDRTRGLIDKEYGLSDETAFAIINTLYLKDLWNLTGNDLPFTDEEYGFNNADGSVTQTKLLTGYYNGGKVYETDEYSAFYTKTLGSYKLKFILPNDGYTVDDIFTAENIATVNGLTDYGDSAPESGTYYATRCFFPEFKCGYDGDLAGILKEKFGIERLFKNPANESDACDFSTLTSSPAYCTAVYHTTELAVDKKGIEGAAGTIMPGGDGAPQPTEKYDFVIDRAFGFIITDSRDITLFSGVVNKI